MNYSEDHIALAAEYALGTLNADERALVETMMIVDHGFREVVEAWDRKLSPLHQMVAPVEPPPHLWDNIKIAVGLNGQPVQPVSEPEPVEQPAEQPAPPPTIASATPDQSQASAVPDQFDYSHINPQLPETASITPVGSGMAPTDDKPIQASPTDVAPPTDTVSAVSEQAPETVVEPIVPVPVSVTEPVAEQSPDVTPSNVLPMRDRKRGGSNAFGWTMTAVAASLAGVIALQAYRPELLPEKLRIKPQIQVVEVAAPAQPLPAQFVAVLQQGAAAPAFILTVDTATKNFTVRKVGATPEPGKSYELWLVSDKLQRPRSLGVIGSSDFTIRPSLADYDADTINRATYAVTIEPEGGSPTGVATGPIVYTGKLVESVPELPAQPR